jgi:hypothetical protein
LAYPNTEPWPIIIDGYLSWQDDPGMSARNVRARAWLAGLTGAAAPADAPLAIQAQASIFGCRIQEADTTLAKLSEQAAEQIDGLQAQLLYVTAFGDGRVGEITTLIRLRNPGLAASVTQALSGISPARNSFYDNRYYDRLGIAPPNAFALPTSASGMSVWLRDPVSAADRGAPGSGLAECR